MITHANNTNIYMFTVVVIPTHHNTDFFFQKCLLVCNILSEQ